MIKNRTIRFFAASILLLLFISSNTPKRFLHHLFANHKDVIVNTTTTENDYVGYKGFQCDCSTFVANSPFIEQETSFVISVNLLFLDLPLTITPPVYSSTLLFIELRGPPMIG